MMLKVTVIPRIGDPPVEVAGATVIVADEHSNPLVAVIKIADQTTLISTVRDGDEFRRILSSLGIDKVVVDDKLIIDGPPKNAELLLDPRKRNQMIAGVTK